MSLFWAGRGVLAFIRWVYSYDGLEAREPDCGPGMIPNTSPLSMSATAVESRDVGAEITWSQQNHTVDLQKYHWL